MSTPDPLLWPLEPSDEQFAQWLAAVGDVVRAELSGLPDAPARGSVGAAGLEIAAQVSVPIPEDPTAGGLPALLQRVLTASKATLGTPTPGYLAYIPGGGLPSSALADLLSGILNRYTGLAAAAPALCRLEADVLAWLAGEFGYGIRHANPDIAADETSRVRMSSCQR
jgi:aromatic-L-amino-acid decarboxylase